MKCRYILVSMFIYLISHSDQIEANIITLNADTEISGGTSPVGVPPWLTASFNDNNSQGTVSLTLTATNLTGTEFVSGWYLNLDPSLDPTNLQFNNLAVSSGSFTNPSIQTG